MNFASYFDYEIVQYTCTSGAPLSSILFEFVIIIIIIIIIIICGLALQKQTEFWVSL